MDLRRRRLLSSFRLLAFLAAVCLFAASCTTAAVRTGTDTQPTVPGGHVLDTSGTVTVGVRSLPTNFNPATRAGDNRITQMVMEQVWPRPFVTDPTFSYQSTALIESAEVQGINPLTVAYVINPKAVWSDGVPITAADFIYCWHEHLEESAGLPDSGLVAGYRDVSSIVSSPSGRTVTVTFGQPFAQWQNLFSDLAPAHVALRYGWAKAFAGFLPDRVLSGGPFEITSFRPGQDLVLSRNPHYWGTPAHVARIRFVVEPSEAALETALKSGAVSVGELPPTVWAPQNGPPAGATAGTGLVASSSSTASSGGSTPPVPTLSWSRQPGNELWQLCFNFDDPLTSQLALRQAIERSLDRSEIVADSAGLLAERSRPALARLTLAGEDATPSSSTTLPVSQHAPALYAPNEALALYRAAGYEPGAGGLLRVAGSGSPLELGLVVPTKEPLAEAAALQIQAELRAIGVTVTLERLPLAEMLSSVLPEGRYQLALAPFRVPTVYAELAPQYTDPVVPDLAVQGALHSPGGGSGGPTGNGGVAGGTAGGSGVGSATGLAGTPASQPPEPWATPARLGTEPGAAAAGVVTRDVFGYSNRAVAEHFAAAISQLNSPAAIADLQHVETILWDDVVSIPLFQTGLVLVRSLRVDNVSESPTLAGIMWDAEDWAILKKAPPTTSSSTSTTSAAGGSAPS